MALGAWFGSKGLTTNGGNALPKSTSSYLTPMAACETYETYYEYDVIGSLRMLNRISRALWKLSAVKDWKWLRSQTLRVVELWLGGEELCHAQASSVSRFSLTRRIRCPPAPCNLELLFVEAPLKAVAKRKDRQAQGPLTK